MPRQKHVARKIVLGASAASFAVAFSACSSRPSSDTTTSSIGTPSTVVGNAATVSQSLRQFATSTKDVSVTMEESMDVNKALTVFVGNGTLVAPSKAWAVDALPANVTNPTYTIKVLEIGGHAYVIYQAFQVALPKVDWIDLVGSTTVLQNSPLENFTISPQVGAEVATAAGVTFHKSAEGNISGVNERGFTATVSASAAVHALTVAGTPPIDAQLAAAVFAHRTLTLHAYLDSFGHLGAFGWDVPSSGSNSGISVTYYVLAKPPALHPVAPTGVIETFAQYIAAAEHSK